MCDDVVWPLFADSLVHACAHERLQLVGVLDTDLDNPVAEGIAVEQLGLVLKCAVYLDHGAAYGRVEVAGGLHALYGSELLACADLVVNVGHVHVYDVSQLVLGIVGNADITVLALNFYILV